MGGSRRLDEAGEQLREDFFRIMREVGRSHRKRSDDQVAEMQGFVQRWRDWDRRNGGDGGANRTPNPVLATDGVGDGSRDGGYDAFVLAAHDVAPDWVAHPDGYSVPTAQEIAAARETYDGSSSIPRGHHVLPLADGGAPQGPITYTGETMVDRRYPHHSPSPGAPLVPGWNPDHSAATALQSLIHFWQRGNGIR